MRCAPRCASAAAQQFPPGVEVAALPDLANPVDWAPLVAGMDAVVHLAGIAHVGPDIAEETYDRVNQRGDRRTCRAAAAAGVRRFVFMSSIRAQAGAAADQPLTEADAPRPTDAYGRSKLAAEGAVRAAGVPYTILRPALVYGPGVKGNLASLMRLAALPVPLPFGAFANRRSLLALDNLIAAVRFALEDARAANETYIVADPQADQRRRDRRDAACRAWPQARACPGAAGLLSAMLRLIGKRDDYRPPRRHAGRRSRQAASRPAGSRSIDTRTALAADGSGRFAAEIRHRVAQHAVDHRALVAREPLLQRREPAAHRLERRTARLRRHDAGDADLGGRLVAREQDFVQPLARPHAGELDLDVAARLKPGQRIIRSARSTIFTGWPMLST